MAYGYLLPLWIAYGPSVDAIDFAPGDNRDLI